MPPEKLWLYESSGCPFCVRVRSFLAKIGETIELRDIVSNREYLAELVRATGTQMVPCLKIEESDGNSRWLHESADIIDYLRDHFKA